MMKKQPLSFLLFFLLLLLAFKTTLLKAQQNCLLSNSAFSATAFSKNIQEDEHNRIVGKSIKYGDDSIFGKYVENNCQEEK